MVQRNQRRNFRVPLVPDAPKMSQPVDTTPVDTSAAKKKHVDTLNMLHNDTPPKLVPDC